MFFLALIVSTVYVSFRIKDLLKAPTFDIWMQSIIFSKPRNISQWIYTSDKPFRRSSLIILRKFILRCCKVEFAFFLSGFRIFTIHRTAGEGKAIFMTCLTCLVTVMICIFNCEVFIYDKFKDYIGLCNSQYYSSYFIISTR